MNPVKKINSSPVGLDLASENNGVRKERGRAGMLRSCCHSVTAFLSQFIKLLRL